MTGYHPENQVWGLYVHVPFCRRKCNYCDFYSLPSESLVIPYLEALTREMEMYGHTTGTVDTVYVGGGTPTLLTAEQIHRVLQAVDRHFTVDAYAEITVEANPEGLDPCYLQKLRDSGMNRLSLGLQSLDDTILEFLGRGHRSKQALNAVTWARKAGFDNLSLDCIYGVPGQDVSAWLEMLRRVLDLEPQHLSLYQLTFESGTPLGRKKDMVLIHPYDESVQRDFFMETAALMKDAGYIHYEVSNFALEEKYMSRHNSKYWGHLPYLGLGPSAHSFQGTNRWWNHRSVKRYINDLHNGRAPVAGSETLDREALLLESLYFGFRTSQGLDPAWLEQRFGLDLAAEGDGLLTRLHNEGWVENKQGRIVPTCEGMVRADALPLLW